MSKQLSHETKTVLKRYIDGSLSNAELTEWLVGAEYDDELPPAERDELAGVRLIVIEVEEGERPKEEVLKAVSTVLATAAEGEQIVALRASSSTQSSGGTVFTASGSPVLRAGIAP